jgi:arginine:ornithine antiporter/lysine permease
VPSAALWLTNVVSQLLLILTMFAREAFNLALALTSAKSLLPYVLVAGFALKLSCSGETYEVRPEERRRDLISAGVATIYMFSAIFFAPGTVLYVIAQRERRAQLFTLPEWIIFAIIIVAAIWHLRAAVRSDYDLNASGRTG